MKKRTEAEEKKLSESTAFGALLFAIALALLVPRHHFAWAVMGYLGFAISIWVLQTIADYFDDK